MTEAPPEKKEPAPSSLSETEIVLRQALELGDTLGINKFIIDSRGVSDIKKVEPYRKKQRIVWMARQEEPLELEKKSKDKVVEVPQVHLNRLARIKVSLFLSLVNNFVRPNEKLICLSGQRRSTILDTMLILSPSHEFPWLRKHRLSPIRKLTDTKIFQQVLELALRFAQEGREGKPVGTIFVIGEPEELKPHVHQLILNPLEGHNQKDRSIYNGEFVESLRELCAVDGAFLVNHRGIAEAAGVFLDASAKKVRVRAGLGARHTAAAAITAAVNCVAVAISESSGMVTVYCKGKTVMELDKFT